MNIEIKGETELSEDLMKAIIEIMRYATQRESSVKIKDGRIYENPRYDFFEKITFEGMKGELSNPHLHRIGNEVDIHLGCQWQYTTDNPELFLKEAIETFKRTEQFQLTRVARGDYITDLKIYSLARKENHRNFVGKNGAWFDDFVHIESQGVHNLYCFSTGKKLEVWWNKIKEELLVFPTCKIYNNPCAEVPFFGRSPIG